MHSYAVQITTDMPQWGGLSGATFEEAQSWGKIRRDARMISCHVDATIALPFIAHALAEKFRKMRRNIPVFNWTEDRRVEIEYRSWRSLATLLPTPHPRGA